MAREEVNDVELRAWNTRARTEHYLHLGATGILLLYIFQLHGVWAALAGLVLIPAATSAVNTLILSATGSLRLVRANRWGVLIILFILLAMRSATVESVQ